MIGWRDVFTWATASLAILCFGLLLGGCVPQEGGVRIGPTAGTPPVVTARESASASLTVITCPQTLGGGALVLDMIQGLSQQSPVVTAYEQASARLIINTCPSPPDPAAIRAAAEAARARR